MRRISAPENRIWQEISRAGRPLADHMILRKPEFLRSALYAEWFAPQGFHSVMAAPVMANGSHSGVVVTFGSRGRGDFDEGDLESLGRVARRFSRALGLRLDRIRLDQEIQVRQNAFDELSEGVLLLDGIFKVRYANPAAGAYLINGTACCFATAVSVAVTCGMIGIYKRRSWLAFRGQC